MARINKNRYWTGVLYPENMRPDWQDAIGDIVQVPYCYCIHDHSTDSKSEHRKDHTHLILAFSNTTTYNHALAVMDLLSAPGKKALNKCEAVINIRSCYDYLIHDTEACRKQGKELYPKSARISGNNFDIGAFEQLSLEEKNKVFMELSQGIVDQNLTNYRQFFDWVVATFEEIKYIEVMRSYSGHFDRLLKGTYQEVVAGAFATKLCCPLCGSVNVHKRGMRGKNQRYFCKDCCKFFTLKENFEK